MAPRPPLDAVALELYEQVAPVAYADEEHGWALAHFCQALALQISEIDVIVRDQVEEHDEHEHEHVGWSMLLDVDRCPPDALPWLAQMVGVTLGPRSPAQSEEEYAEYGRAFIDAADGWARGRPASMLAIAKFYMTGDKLVYLRERIPTPYSLSMVFKESELPPDEVASTNMLTNSGLETNTTGWNPNSATLSRDTTMAKFGTASLKSICPGSVAGEGPYLWPITGIVPGATYTYSCWMWIPVGNQIPIYFDWRNAADAYVGNSNPQVVTGTGDWQWCVHTAVAPATTAKALIPHYTSPAQAVTFWIDGAQLEQKSFATAYIHTDGAPASRAALTGPMGVALQRAKPAGIVMDFTGVVGWDYIEVDNVYASYAALDTAHPTYSDLVEGP